MMHRFLSPSGVGASRWRVRGQSQEFSSNSGTVPELSTGKECATHTVRVSHRFTVPTIVFLPTHIPSRPQGGVPPRITGLIISHLLFLCCVAVSDTTNRCSLHTLVTRVHPEARLRSPMIVFALPWSLVCCSIRQNIVP